MEEMMTGGQELSQEVVIALSGHAPVPAPTTVMASDVDVSNGFVKNGTSLPYIIDCLLNHKVMEAWFAR